jgi:hypothetical protein
MMQLRRNQIVAMQIFNRMSVAASACSNCRSGSFSHGEGVATSWSAVTRLKSNPHRGGSRRKRRQP